MEKILLDVYSQETNTGVVKMPGRGLPGIVIEGDVLSQFVDTAWDIRDLLYDGKREQAENLAQEHAERLAELLDAYLAVLAANGLALP